MSIIYTDLREDHLEEAARLVATRYRALRQGLPLLPPRYEDGAEFLPLLASIIPGSTGIAAIRENRLAGFLTGFVIPDFQGKRSIYSPEWANAAPLGESRILYEEMYARASAQWVSDGCVTHLLSLMADDRQGMEGWQWLGFGRVGVDAVRSLDPVESRGSGIEIRRATVGDLETAQAFEEALRHHMVSAPTFWHGEPREYAAWLEDPANALWFALDQSTPVACLGVMPGHPEGCWILRDEKGVKIISAFTLAEARGRGMASALLNHALRWARTEGYERCTVDFEAMNLLGRRFWLDHFDPVTYAFMRCLPEKLTHGS